MLLRERLVIKKISATGAVLCALSSGNILAGGKITIDEDTYVTLGAGIRAGYSLVEEGAPDAESFSKDFSIQNVRLYIGGQLAPDWKFTVNTEEIFGEYGILDAMIQYEPNAYFNVWAGRVLTPADRIEMNGPFYGLSWNQYTVPLYPSDNDPQGRAGLYNRDDGVVVWGAVDKFQYALGMFNGLNTEVNKTDAPLLAMRLAYNFLNVEKNPGYYTSSTYYGGLGDIFTIGFALQSQKDGTGSSVDDAADFIGYSIDALFEKVFTGGAVLTIEGEYKQFDTDYRPQAGDGGFGMFDGSSLFGTAAYLFANKVGFGQFQPYVRYTQNSPEDGESSDLTELGLNYVINGHKLRLNANITNGDANLSGIKSSESIMTAAFGVQYQI